MTKLSRRNLDPKDLGLYINNLWSGFTLLDSKDQVRALFHDLFTHTEYKMFAKRLEIARRLLDGQMYDEISDSLKVTNHTIAAVSNILERDGAGMRVVHDKLKKLDKSFKNKKSRKFFPRYKNSPRVSELLDAGLGGAGKIMRTINRRHSSKKQLAV
jgi:uncharacterized protein YerC